MAQEYIALKERNNAGVIALSKSAFQTIAKIVVEEDENIRLADSATPFKYPISCKIVNDQLILSIDIKVKYSVNVNEESSKVQSKIFENIEHMTGIHRISSISTSLAFIFKEILTDFFLLEQKGCVYMAVSLEDCLVIGISSRALFDLDDEKLHI